MLPKKQTEAKAKKLLDQGKYIKYKDIAFVESNSLEFMYLFRSNRLLFIFLTLLNVHFFAVYILCNFILKRTLEQKLF